MTSEFIRAHMAGGVSVAEITKHATPDNCWIVLNGKVYDLTKFAPEHPGGADMVYKWAGKDGSKTYNMYHSAELIETTLSDGDKKGDFDESTITDTWHKAQQGETISAADPNEKPPLSSIINLDDFEQAFYRSGPRKAIAYISGASNDLLSLNANKTCWQKLWFRPRVMRNVSVVNTAAKMLGQDVSMPVWICPMGIAKTAGPDGEKALAAGAKESNIIHCVSTAASYSVEDIIAAAPDHPFFFQLYVDKQREKSEELLRKIKTLTQVKAIFVTADLPVVSKREADERVKTQESVSVYVNSARPGVDKNGGGLARSTGNFIDWALNWDDIAWLRKQTDLPIVVKGIQSAADAKMALKMGCEGIVITNHGGRALDSSPGTVLILLEIRRDCPEVFEKMEVHIDGGVRRGSDVLKAILIGAKGVGVGRPFQTSVAYGTEGVEHCASILLDELETAMRLCGITDLNAVRGDMSWLNTAELDPSLPPRLQEQSWLGRLFRARL